MSQCWELLIDLLMAERSRIPTIAAEFDLSPMQAQLLRVVAPGRPVPMGRLAGALGCDPSNITGIVDRLEARGLIERRPAPGDRRVKALVITPAGARLRATMLRRMSEPPEPVARLSPEDQRTLERILRSVITTR
jgi:DNA-binding MarR family transcriptional regulator